MRQATPTHPRPGPTSDVDAHDTDLLDCWCGPTYHVACDDCDPVDYRGAARVYLFEPPTTAGCWKCRGGLVAISRAEAGVTKETLIVVHAT